MGRIWRNKLLLATLLAVVVGGWALWSGQGISRGALPMVEVPPSQGELSDGTKIALPMSEDQWRAVLTAEQFQVCRKQGTERAFTGAYWNTKDRGVYRCVCCGNELFASETKFDSGTGWPSFFAPRSPTNVGTREDRGWFTRRTEAHCNKCGAHLGHVFDDGPAPTGMRYCINSVALRFEEAPAK